MAELKFHVVQIESKNLELLLSTIEQAHIQAPEKWGEIKLALEFARGTQIEWADWNVPDEDLSRSSIPLIKWGTDVDWQMGMSIPASLASHLAMHPPAPKYQISRDVYAKIQALGYNASVAETYQTLVDVFMKSLDRFPEKIPQIIELLSVEDMEEIIQFQVC